MFIEDSFLGVFLNLNIIKRVQANQAAISNKFCVDRNIFPNCGGFTSFSLQKSTNP